MIEYNRRMRQQLAVMREAANRGVTPPHSQREGCLASGKAEEKMA